ncbi:pseudouridine-5'-phosphatase-like [Oppia nitens]|uniref:pseudouridine-5'-phosphatase-like n=1 Tax=Oppia nitens TaxID=1686743 RepID=UPI0023DBCC46|nr:pseudouridine-5'-phosphatase-like [Oppia nitens]
MSGQQFVTPVTHVVFDMDGLLLDTEPRYERAINTVTTRYGKPYPLELRVRVIGTTQHDQAELVVRELGLPITPDQYIEELNKEYYNVFDQVPFLPGAERLVRHLHLNRVPIAIATSSKRHTFEMKTRDHQELFKLFEHILICSDDPDVKRGKPDPQSYEVAVTRFRSSKPQSMANVLVFEDSPAGVRSGMGAGCQVVWVPAREVPRSMASPTITLDSLLDFRPEVFGLPPFDD